MVGVAGIEPAASCSQSKRASAAPHPEPHSMIRVEMQVGKVKCHTNLIHRIGM